MQEHNYEDRAEPEDNEVVEITEETLEKVGGGTVGIWFY
jgi:hypothetical protein